MSRVPYDRELEPGLAEFLARVEAIPLRPDTIVANRAQFKRVMPSLEEVIDGRPITAQEYVAPGPAGGAELAVTVLRPSALDESAPGFFGIHGGGMILGDRHFGAVGMVDDLIEFGAVGASVEYRLAPEHPAPAAAEDCFAGLCWFAAHADRLGVDLAGVVICGASAGGGLSAAVALMARDRGGPALLGQVLDWPMLDDRNVTVSSRQYDGVGNWDRNNNDTAWDALLGDARGTADVSPYASPTRATDLSGLPPAFIDVGSAEVFRDEAVDYATRIWAAGGQAELHVWTGGYHGFAEFSPEAQVSEAAVAAKRSWLRRLLAPNVAH